MKFFISYIIMIEIMQLFSLYMQMTSTPDPLYNMKSVKLSQLLC